MQTSIYMRVPHVRDGLIVANVGSVTYAVEVADTEEATIHHWESY
jgi:hypothetical protein